LHKLDPSNVHTPQVVSDAANCPENKT